MSLARHFLLGISFACGQLIGPLWASAIVPSVEFVEDYLPISSEPGVAHATMKVHDSAASALTTVPLPSSLSMFGAAILAFGLVGFATGAWRLGGSGPVRIEADQDVVSPPRPSHAPNWIRIEISGPQGPQVCHASSPLEAIERIADLLNAGCDIVSLTDRCSKEIQYDDILLAWNEERAR